MKLRSFLQVASALVLGTSTMLAATIASTGFETAEGFPSNQTAGGFQVTDPSGDYWEVGEATGNYAGTWNSGDAIVTGSQGCVFGNQGNTSPYLLANPAGADGIGDLSFWVHRTGGSGTFNLQIQYTLDDLAANPIWTTLHDVQLTDNNQMTNYSYTINQTGDVKVRIYTPISGHISVDDVTITDYTPTLQEVPILVTIGQSNSDGWGAAWNFDYDELEKYQDPRFPNRMGATIKSFYDANPNDLKVFYKAFYGQVLADRTPQYPGLEQTWIDLNYQSDLANGKSAMISRQSLGTHNDGAKYARSMEAPFGYYWKNGSTNKAAQNSPLYVIKAGAGGSAISTWNSTNAGNWSYFRDQVYKPAIEALIADGKKPKLVGVYWMQGETDRNNSEYEAELEKLAALIRSELSFPTVPLFIGAISGEDWNPTGTAPAYLAQVAFCNEPANNAILIQNQTANRKFYGDMTTDGFTLDPIYSDVNTYGVAESWTGSPSFQNDPASSANHGHYTAGAQVEIAEEVYEHVVDATWAELSTFGTWENLSQSPDNVIHVTFTPTFPSGGTLTSIEYENPENTWTTTLPTVTGNYPVRAQVLYNQGTALEFTTIATNTLAIANTPTIIVESSFETSEGFPANSPQTAFDLIDNDGDRWIAGTSGNYAGTWNGGNQTGALGVVIGNQSNPTPYLTLDPVNNSGVGTVTFSIKKTGGTSSANADPILQFQWTKDPIDGNESWNTALADERIDNTNWETYQIVVNQTDDVKIRWFMSGVAVSGDAHFSIDDVTVTDHQILTPVLGLQLQRDGSLIEWTVDREENVKSYQVQTRDGAVIATIPATNASQYSFILPDSWLNHEIVLAVIDQDGFTQIFAPTNQRTQTVIYSLNSGWNLIALPFSEISNPRELQQLGNFWVYENGQYQISPARPNALDAFWVYTENAKQFTISGILTTATSVQLEKGWNLYGPSENMTAPAEVEFIYSFEKAYDQVLQNSGLLIQGRGYWFYAENDETIQL